MHNICKGYSDQNSANLMSPSVVSCPSRWNSSVSHYPQSSLSNSRTLEADSPHQQYYKVKQMGHQVQEQDSSSTQSTGQSHQEVAATEGGIPNWQSGCNGTHGTRVDSEMKSVLSLGNPNYAYPAPQVDYSQSVARLPYAYPDSCFGGLMAPCGPQAVIHSPMMGIMPGRVPLPLNLAEDEPMYVNAKQYRAILRRREARARLEAQNKLVKARKPYLHESRHLHALKRVRGSGGRFVNTKQQQQQSKPTSTTNRQNTLDFGLSQRNRNRSESEFRSETSEVGASTTSCSEVTDLSNNDYMLRQPGHMFSCYPNRYMSASRC